MQLYFLVGPLPVMAVRTAPVHVPPQRSPREAPLRPPLRPPSPVFSTLWRTCRREVSGSGDRIWESGELGGRFPSFQSILVKGI